MIDATAVALSAIHNVGRTYFQRRYTILFYTLVFTVVASPVIASFGLSGGIIESLLAASLLTAVMPVEMGTSRRFLLAIMAAVWLARPAIAWLGHEVLSAMTLIVWTLIGFCAAAIALRYALRGEKVDSEHLYAALSAYLLAGVYFGLLYWVLEQVRPGTFVTAGNFSRTGAVYFSFVTLATLGYGDIVPRSDVARGLAIVEGVGGQLFLAVLVARLLSLYSRPTED
jgi:ion channel